MTNCPTCGFLLPAGPVQLGARCPACHDPLYEPPGRVARVARDGEATCYVHAGMSSVGVCPRCRHHLCETCRTRWHGKILCSGCVDRIVSATPAGAFDAPRLRQARAGAYLGVATWAVGILGVVFLGRVGLWSGTAATVGTFLLLSLLTGNVLLASLAAGHSAAALRASEEPREFALAGLVLGGLYVAVVLGVGVLTLWQS